MSLITTLTQAATITSGILSSLALLSFLVDAVTRGWVRKHVRRWLGIQQLRGQQTDTQTFILDLASAHNDLAEAVIQQHDINDEPAKIDTEYYDKRLRDNDVERGDFLTKGKND